MPNIHCMDCWWYNYSRSVYNSHSTGDRICPCLPGILNNHMGTKSHNSGEEYTLSQVSIGRLLPQEKPRLSVIVPEPSQILTVYQDPKQMNAESGPGLWSQC